MQLYYLFLFRVTTEPYLKIINPSGGEKWQKGREVVIKWEAKNISGLVKVQLESPNEKKALAILAASNGKLNITVPYSLNRGEEWKVVIISQENNEVNDRSDNISIGVGF